MIAEDERTKLLIAHGGYNSLVEAAKAGVPCLLMPLFADQNINAQRATRHGIGQVQDKIHIDSPTIVDKMRRLIEDTTYKNASHIYPQLLAASVLHSTIIHLQCRYKRSATRLSGMLADKLGDSRSTMDAHLRLAAKGRQPRLAAAQRLSYIDYHSLGSVAIASVIYIYSATVIVND